MLSIQKKYRSFRQSSRRRRLALSVLAVLAGAVFAQAALASNITIASPLSGATTTSPILVKAHNVGCNGLTPTAFGFSIDNSTTTTMGATANDLDFQNVSVSTGKHLIHFKAWVHGGICPVVDQSINVATAAGTSGSGTGTSGTGTSGTGGSGTGTSGTGDRQGQAASRRASPRMRPHRLTWIPQATGRENMTPERLAVRRGRRSSRRPRRYTTMPASST